jgi:SSS family solute:Na+ symporter
MATADLLTIALYFVLLVGIGVYVFRKKQKTQEEYYLAGRSVPWLFVMASLFATDMSSTAFIGQAGAGYRTGLLYANFQWVAVACILVLVMWLLPIYLRNRIITLPEFLERRYGPSARTIYSAISILIYFLVEIPGVLFAGSLLLGTVTNLKPLPIFIVLGLLTGLYTIAGGLRAVIYADFMQAAFILVGGLYLGFASLHAVGGWGALQAGLPATFFSAVQSEPSDIPWAALLTGLPVLGLWYWTTNQMILQRVLGAKSINEGRIGALGAGLLKFTLPPMLVLPGMCAAVMFPGLGEADAAYPMLIENLVPVGFRGLVVASFTAAMMSHVEGALNSASTLYVQDIHLPLFNRQTTDEQAIRLGKIVGFIMIAGALLIAKSLHVRSLYDYLQLGYSFAAAPAVVLFLAGIFWKRANRAGATAAYVGGLGVMGLLVVANRVPWFTDRFAWMAMSQYYQVAWAALAALVCYVVVSLVTPAPSAEQVASGALYQEEPLSAQPLLKRWPIWALACAACLVATYVVFR